MPIKFSLPPLPPTRSRVCVWFGALLLIIPALLGDYPTPVVGYGGSAIIGYLPGLLILPQRGVMISDRANKADEQIIASGHDQLRLAAAP